MKQHFLAILFIVEVVCGFGAASVASSTPEEYRKTLNGIWHFKIDRYDTGQEEKWFLPETNMADWDKMRVPGNWDLKNEYANYAGVAWYRKSFIADQLWEDKAVRLYFESVYNDAQVWLNGEHIGEHHIGFLPFWFDIEDRIQPGEENTLVVRVDNTFKRGAIWNWGGIRRPVWLEITDKARLEYQHISAIPDLENGTAKVGIEFEINNKRQEEAEIRYQLEILKDDELIWETGKSIKKNAVTVSPMSKRKASVDLQLPKSKVQLWHFNHPHLYTARLKIYHKGKLLHQLEDRFGIRKVEVDGHQFKLNGEAVRTVGFNLVPEDRVTGNTLPLWRIKEDVDLMKSLGVNMTRMSHLPLPKAMLDYLDEKGIMIFEEVSLWGKDEMVDPDHPLPKYWLEKMVSIKYNHPCIIGWSVGNEIGFTDRNPKVMEYVKGAIEQAKSLDPTRLAIYVSHSAHKQQNDPVKYSDMILYNAYGKWGEGVEKIRSKHDDKPIFMSEFGQKLNDEDPNEAHIDIEKMMDEFRGKPYMTGASLWTFNDYRSSWRARKTWDTPPSQNRTWGIVNTFRQKKKPFFAVKKEYAPVKEMKVMISGKKVKVDITPRGKMDIPAYEVADYRLAWMVLDKKQKLLDGGLAKLPVIKPGDEVFESSFLLSPDQKASMQVHLLDPQAYSVLDTTIYFSQPEAPEITAVHTGNDAIRIVYEPQPDASSYKLRYGEINPDQETEPTIDHFIEIKDLKPHHNYQFELIAINGAGETTSGIHHAKTDVDELPPVIWATVPADHSFFVGYSVDPTDYLYEVEYGTRPGEYDKLIRVQTKGVLQVPDLENGKTYYYRLRRRMQWGFASEWTNEIVVTPDGKVPPNGHMNGKALLKDKEMLITHNPVEKAIGYQVHLVNKTSGFHKEYFINKAQSGFSLIKVRGDLPVKNFKVEIRCQNEYGFSEWEEVEVLEMDK